MQPDWTLQKAIKDQVDKEDWAAWALRGQQEFKPIPPMLHTVWKAAPLHALLSKITP